MDVIVDGYNLIFCCGLEGKRRTRTSIRRSRTRLINLIAELLDDQQRSRVTIVFDAQSLPAGETQIASRRQGIQVLFSVGYEDADSLIEELITDHSHPKQLYVVSSDHRIQTAALRRKATAMDSDRWLDQLENRSAAPTASPGRRAGNGKRDAASDDSKDTKSIEDQFEDVDWMQEFGFDDQS